MMRVINNRIFFGGVVSCFINFCALFLRKYSKILKMDFLSVGRMLVYKDNIKSN